MRKRLDALLVAGAVVGAPSLHAEPALPPQPGGLWQSVHGRPALWALALLGLVLLLGLAVVFWRRAAGRGEPAASDGSYDAGAEPIQPAGPVRRDAPLRPASMHTVGFRTDTVVAPADLPADFDVPRFLRKSRAAFVRLQAAWDQGDLKDIRRFTSRELYREFCRQLRERGGAPNVTEVVALGAELHGVETVDEYYIAKVKFSGMIRADAGAPAAPFAEVWRLSKPLDGHRSWIVAGIEQY